MKNNYSTILYRILSPIIKTIVRLYYNPTIINKEAIPNNGPVVIAGNHIHPLDPIMVDYSTKRVIHTLAKKELHDGPFGWFFRAIGSIPVDRGASHNKNALDSAVKYLKNGYAINVSPEGKVNKTDETLLPFKYGAVVMASRTNCPIIPYSITGKYHFRSKSLKVVFGKPIYVKDMSIEDANKLLYETIKESIEREEKKYNEKESKSCMV